MPEQIVCWKCGQSLASLPTPIRRRDVCPECDTDLHVCKNCIFFDPSKYRSCLEPIATEARDKDKSNFCDYFKINKNAYDANRNNKANEARSQLDSLFGTSPAPADTNKTAEQIAKDKLNDLFSGK